VGAARPGSIASGALEDLRGGWKFLATERVVGAVTGIEKYGSGIMNFVVDGPAPSTAQVVNLR